MVPLYAARIEDLRQGDFVRVECAACGHETLIPQRALLQYEGWEE
jgi:ribosomal protein S27E